MKSEQVAGASRRGWKRGHVRGGRRWRGGGRIFSGIGPEVAAGGERGVIGVVKEGVEAGADERVEGFDIFGVEPEFGVAEVVEGGGGFGFLVAEEEGIVLEPDVEFDVEAGVESGLDVGGRILTAGLGAAEISAMGDEDHGCLREAFMSESEAFEVFGRAKGLSFRRRGN